MSAGAGVEANLLLDVRDGVATVTLNRPKASNAIDPELRAALKAAWTRISRDDDIRVAILTGTGERTFCAGSDLRKTMPPAGGYAAEAFLSPESDHLFSTLSTNKPLICAINGHALGAGLELALACDIRIATPNATFASAEARWGTMPGAGATQLLPRLVGESHANVMLLTGNRVDAATALRTGLVSEVVEPDALLARAKELAADILRCAPLSVAAIKKLVRLGRGDSALGQEVERLTWGLLRNTEDRVEGRRAFQEDRAPRFQGR